MKTVRSKDGTTIAFDQTGTDPAVILVSGAIQYRAFDQGSTQPFAVEREIEDIEALIEEKQLL